MSLKVVDVPDGAETLMFYKGFDDPWKGVKIADLPDAPTVAENATVEKRVIELPAELLSDFKDMLSAGSDNDHDYHVGKFLKSAIHLVNDWQVGHEKVLFNENDLADWYLGHVEFVPKKEAKYRYKLNGFDASIAKNVVAGELFLMSGFNREHQTFTRSEIEKLASEKGFKLSAFKEIEVED